jgi:hypothetical protein
VDNFEGLRRRSTIKKEAIASATNQHPALNYAIINFRCVKLRAAKSAVRVAFGRERRVMIFG